MIGWKSGCDGMRVPINWDSFIVVTLERKCYADNSGVRAKIYKSHCNILNFLKTEALFDVAARKISNDR